LLAFKRPSVILFPYFYFYAILTAVIVTILLHWKPGDNLKNKI
jgi:hypothetical protein